MRLVAVAVFAWFALVGSLLAQGKRGDRTVRVFVFAGQSNMEGAHSRVEDVERFPPFADATAPLAEVRYWHVVGREDKQRSDGFVPLRPFDTSFGPELTFAREVLAHAPGPLAIVKVAAGGTTLGKDWNPDTPGGFELYPLAIETVKKALAELDQQRLPWRLEAVVWHQGENDMFEPAFREAYAGNLRNFIACWRRDLGVPDLRFYVGELCTKTVWGMDNRMPMYAISVAQRAVADADPRVRYIPTSHVGVEIGGDDGLHYHYGTLGQLEHGVEYARAWLDDIGSWQPPKRPLRRWPYAKDAAIDLFVLAGHRNMEGERAFVQELRELPGGKALAKDRHDVAFRYATGGGVHQSDGFEPLGPAGLYDTFGPELSFAEELGERRGRPLAIAKFTHSGSQIVDWTPKGSDATARNLYETWIAFVRALIAELEAKGHTVRLAGVCYHLGENDTSWGPHRQKAAAWLGELIAATRRDLGLPELRWFVSQQQPTQHEGLDKIDVVAAVRALAAADPHLVHVEAFDPPPQRERLVFDTKAVVWLGERIAAAVRQAER